MITPLTIYIGFDERETIAWHVLVNSILEHSSRPVSFVPLNLTNLRHIDFQTDDKRASNAFSYSRFLVPYLSNFQGTSIFMDCDMLVTVDINEVLSIASDAKKAVHVVQHDYTSSVVVKYLGNKQENYPRKNWSSFVVWNCAHEKNRILTPDYVKSASPAHLHRFHWLQDNEIGALGREWNWLVGEYPYDINTQLPKIIHWTIGGPYFKEYTAADFAPLWRQQLEKTNRVDQLA
jgi:lipopolysaccharide biosynthesis glycosyltransferase